MSKLKIALLFGGKSEERDVSLRSANEVYEALDKDKYEISRFDLCDDRDAFVLACCKKEFDLVLPILHGEYGEDGRLQGLLDILDIPYVFSGCKASTIAMDKYQTLLLAQSEGISICPHLLLREQSEFNSDYILSRLSLPLVLKPVSSGSSYGISIIKEKEALDDILSKKINAGESELLIEEYRSGRELTVPIMGEANMPVTLPIVEIKPLVADWFDYNAKYTNGGSEEICPADISEEIAEQVRIAAKKIYRAIACRDLARADFIYDSENNELYFLEINTIPGMTATSLVPLSAKKQGYSFGEFLDLLIANAKKR